MTALTPVRHVTRQILGLHGQSSVDGPRVSRRRITPPAAVRARGVRSFRGTAEQRFFAPECIEQTIRERMSVRLDGECDRALAEERLQILGGKQPSPELEAHRLSIQDDRQAVAVAHGGSPY